MESYPLRPTFTEEAEERNAASKRLLSLDVFRGLTIVGMLLVNNLAVEGKTLSALSHAPWNEGIHLADLVFPWFLFIVGVAIPFASVSRKRKGLSRRQNFLGIFGRTLTLVLLGCLIDSSIHKRPLFDIDVLQLIGMAYFVGVLLYELPMLWRLSVAAVFLLGHWAAIRFIPIPGMGTGAFAPHVNLIAYLDDTFLGRLHLRGLVSVIPTSAMVLIGSAVGDVLRDESYTRLLRATLVILGGLALAGAGLIWNLDLPFNKPLWTSSYIVFCAGWASLVFGLLYFIIDVAGSRRWVFPFVVFGTNAIVAYVLPILVKLYILGVWTWPSVHGADSSLQQVLIDRMKSAAGPSAGGWLYTISYILFWWLVLLQLYRKKVFLRV